MTFKWPRLWFKSHNKPGLSAIFIAESAGMPMHSMPEVEAITNQGLVGDRYFNKTGYWDPVEGCQLTLISEHDLKLARQGNKLEFDEGQHRRNLVIKGIKTKALKDKQFQIGDVIFSYEKPRPPCGYLNKIEGRGMAKALSYNSGICIKVIQGGKLRVGDLLTILD